MPRGARRRLARPGGAVLGATVVLLVTAGLLAGAPDAGADDALGTTGLSGNGTIRVDTATDQNVTVVAHSTPFEDRVAIVVANGTTQPVSVRKVVATATAASGAHSVRAVDRIVVPRVLQPGEQALGSVRFRRGGVKYDDTLAFDVTPGKVRSTDPVPLATGSFVMSPVGSGRGGAAQTLDLVVTNDSTRTVDGRVDVQVVCLNEAGIPAGAASGAVKKAKLAPGATTPASVDFALLCPVYVVGAQGRAAR